MGPRRHALAAFCSSSSPKNCMRCVGSVGLIDICRSRAIPSPAAAGTHACPANLWRTEFTPEKPTSRTGGRTYLIDAPAACARSASTVATESAPPIMPPPWGPPDRGQSKESRWRPYLRALSCGGAWAAACPGWLAGWFAGARVASHGSAGLLAGGARTGARMFWCRCQCWSSRALGFCRRPSNRGGVFCLPLCSRAVSWVDKQPSSGVRLVV